MVNLGEMLLLQLVVVMFTLGSGGQIELGNVVFMDEL